MKHSEHTFIYCSYIGIIAGHNVLTPEQLVTTLFLHWNNSRSQCSYTRTIGHYIVLIILETGIGTDHNVFRPDQ